VPRSQLRILRESRSHCVKSLRYASHHPRYGLTLAHKVALGTSWQTPPIWRLWIVYATSVIPPNSSHSSLCLLLYLLSFKRHWALLLLGCIVVFILILLCSSQCAVHSSLYSYYHHSNAIRLTRSAQTSGIALDANWLHLQPWMRQLSLSSNEYEAKHTCLHSQRMN